MTSVVNIRDLSPGWEEDLEYVYVGRAGRGRRGEYGNRHLIGYCPACRREHDRAAAIEAFRVEARRRYEADAAYRGSVERLRGRKLACFCKPLACHGDVYLELLG